jgi:adenine deaminase
MVFAAGMLVAENGHVVADWPAPAWKGEAVTRSVRVPWERVSLDVSTPDGTNGPVRARVIGAHEHEIGTDSLVANVRVDAGKAQADPGRDIAKLAVVQRHTGSGDIGLGFVHGLGLKRGAIAGSVGHDAHNLVVAGCDDRSMMTALRTVAASGGGLAACVGETVLAHVALPIAGLMSEQPVLEVHEGMRALIAATHEMGSSLDDAFLPLSFLSLEVIPALRLTDQGLVDVARFDFVPLWV